MCHPVPEGAGKDDRLRSIRQSEVRLDIEAMVVAGIDFHNCLPDGNLINEFMHSGKIWMTCNLHQAPLGRFTIISCLPEIAWEPSAEAVYNFPSQWPE